MALSQKAFASLFTLTRASTGTYVTSGPNMQVAAAGTLRYGFNDAGPGPALPWTWSLGSNAISGLVIEEGRANLFNNNTTSAPSVVGPNTCASSVLVSPIYGGASVWKHTRVGSGDSNIGSISVGPTIGVTYALSLWMYIPTTCDFTSFTLSAEGDSVQQPDGSTSSTLFTWTPTSGIPKGVWFRFQTSVLMTASAGFIALVIRPTITTPTANSYLFTHLWQFETVSNLSFRATSVIPTSGIGTVNRSPDDVTFPLPQDWFNAAGGTALIQFVWPSPVTWSDASGSFPTLLSFGNPGNGSERLEILAMGASMGQPTVRLVHAGVTSDLKATDQPANASTGLRKTLVTWGPGILRAKTNSGPGVLPDELGVAGFGTWTVGALGRQAFQAAGYLNGIINHVNVAYRTFSRDEMTAYDLTP